MNFPPSIPLKYRLLLLATSWLIAGLIYATCADFNVEAGYSRFTAQIQMVGLAPLVAAQGLAFCIVPGGYNAWPGRQLCEELTGLALLGVFLVVTVLLLTRREQQQFIRWSGAQIGILLLSVVAVLYYFHWDAIHMHG